MEEGSERKQYEVTDGQIDVAKTDGHKNQGNDKR